MSDEQIFAVIDASFYDGHTPNIGLSGGEAFLYFERLCRVIDYAKKKGASVAINTNAFWGITFDKAFEKVQRIKELGVSLLTVSVDDFHEAYIPRKRVLNVVRACKKGQLEVRIQFVATKSTGRLADFLKESGDQLIDVDCREIACQPVGRAEQTIRDEDLFTSPEIPDGKCPSAILSISASGAVIPCCNSAGHLPSLQLGSVDESIPDLHEKFLSDPVMVALRYKGPKALLGAAERAGYSRRRSGYVDQCHLCHDLFKDPGISRQLKAAARNIKNEVIYTNLVGQYQANLCAP